MSYPVFKDLEKPVADIFSDDFDVKYFLKIKSAAPAGVAITTNTQYDPKKEGVKLITKVSAKWAHESGFTLEKLEVASNGSVATETSLVGAAPGLKLEFKGNDSDKGDLSFTYKTPVATVTGELDALKFSKLSGSISGGNGPFSGGLASGFNLSKSILDPVKFTVAYTIPKSLLVVVKASNNFSEFGALASYVTSKDVTVAGTASYTSKGLAFFLGGIYKCNPNTTIKVKASSVGAINAAVKQALDKKCSLVAAAEAAPGFSSLKFAVNATLG